MTTTELAQQHAANLADVTINAFNGDVASISITDGISLIDSWVSILRDHDQATSAIADGLTELKAELQSGNPDGSQVRQLLDRLVGQTSQVTDTIDAADSKTVTKANALVEALQSFSQQLSDSGKSANTSEQAPMTSTVGGESTNSGVGTSGLDSSDDSLSGRSGGTISNGPAPSVSQETDDTSTITTERSSGTSGDEGDSNSSATHESRSDTGRVSGPGISGGAGDSDYSQSGGRSQY
jgi:hypothetical protein